MSGTPFTLTFAVAAPLWARPAVAVAPESLRLG
jgi:hypothetical protein